jgi:hypothetical protein
MSYLITMFQHLLALRSWQKLPLFVRRTKVRIHIPMRGKKTTPGLLALMLMTMIGTRNVNTVTYTTSEVTRQRQYERERETPALPAA